MRAARWRMQRRTRGIAKSVHGVSVPQGAQGEWDKLVRIHKCVMTGYRMCERVSM